MPEDQIRRWALALIAFVGVVWAASAAVGFVRGVVVLTALGFGLAFLALWRPEVGLFGIGMLCALDTLSRRFVFTGDPIPWNTFNYLLLAVMVVRARDLIRYLSVPQVKILLALLVTLFVALWWSPDRENGKLHFLCILAYLGLLVFLERGTSNRAVLPWVATFVGSVTALGSPVFYLQEGALPYMNANAWAYFPLTGIFAATLAAPLAPKGSRISLALLTLTGLNGIWVFLSGSRGSSFVALCCTLYIVLKLGVSLRSVGIAAVVLAGAMAVSTPFLGKSSFAMDKITKLFEGDRSLTNRTSGRSDLALGGWYIFVDHPMGIGTGGFAPAWSRLGARRGLSRFHMDTEFPAHSAWIKVLAENGVPGILLFLAFVGSFAIVGLGSGSSNGSALGILTTVVLAVAFLSTEFQPKGLWFLAAGSTVLLSRVSRRRRVPHEDRAVRRVSAGDSAA